MSRWSRSRNWRTGLALATAVPLLGSASLAFAQHRDILLAVHGERVVTGSFDWGSATATVPVRVFQRAFEYVEKDVAVGTNPGFNAIDAPPRDFMALPEGRELAVRLETIGASGALKRNLLYWDPSHSPPFVPAPNGEAFQLHHRDGQLASADGTDETVAGFVIATTAEQGILHEHVNLVLLAGGSLAPGDGSEAPTEGVYAVSLVFEMRGLAASPPSFLLMAHGENAEGSLEDAAMWIDANLVPECFDGRDNDLDGKTDYPNDPDCESLDGVSESPGGDLDAGARDGEAGVGSDASLVDAANTAPSDALIDVESDASAPPPRAAPSVPSGCGVTRARVEAPLGLLCSAMGLLSVRRKRSWKR